MTASNLTSLFRPSSVAFIGASSNPDRLTGRPVRFIQRHGFTGSIQVVHPIHDEVGGIAAVRSVADLVGTPDVAVIMLPAALVPGVAEECGQLGVRHLVVLSAGFEETGEGVDLAARLRSIAKAYGMGIVGPNSEGLWFVPSHTTLTFGSAADREALPGGPVAVISQSGSIGASLTRRLNDIGLGTNAFVSVGNETVLHSAQYLSWLAQHGEVRVIACFLEGLKHGRQFLEAAAEARVHGVAVVVLQSGTSDAGRAASASHTGKIASSAEVYRSLFRQAGIIQVDTIEQLADAAVILAGPRLRATVGQDQSAGLTVIGLSGGSRSIIADATSQRGIKLAVLTEKTSAELREFTPDFGVVVNPVDPTGQVLSDPQLFVRTIDALAADPNTEALIIQYANGGLGQLRAHLPTLTQAVRSRRLPVMASCLLDQLPATDDLRRGLIEHGIAYAHDPSQAVTSVGRLFQWRLVENEPPLQCMAEADDPTIVDDWASLSRWAAEHGIRTPREVVVPLAAGTASVVDAISSAQLAPPLVVKASPDDVKHKAELGLIRLNVESAAVAASTVAEFHDLAPDVGRILIQEQVPTDIELLVVLEVDKDFGPVLGIGMGGFFVELFKEISYVSLPASPSEVEHALASTRAIDVIQGYRGGRAVDVGTVARALSRLGNGYARLAARPRLVELNPVIIDSRGDLLVLDSLVEDPEGTR